MPGIKPIKNKWAGTMTGRERFRRQMNFQSFDRTFNMEFGYWNENFHEWDMFVKSCITNNHEADFFFNFDRIETSGGNTWMHPSFPSKVIEERGSSKICLNGDGVLCEIFTDGKDSIPHFLRSSIEKPEDWKRVKEERFRLDDPARIVDVEAVKRRHPDDRDYPLGVGCGSMIGKIRDMLTFEGLTFATFDYPDMVEDMVETCCQLVEHSLDQLLPHIHFDFASSWEDICFRSGPLVSVEFMREIALPRYKRISAKLHQYGVTIWYTDCDGDVRPILPIFLEGGINCLFPFEVMGCAHPGTILDAYPGAIRIMGGVDKIQLGAGKKAIREYLESLAPYVARGGYIPFCDHRCPPNVKEDDYLYYLNLKERMFGLQG